MSNRFSQLCTVLIVLIINIPCFSQGINSRKILPESVSDSLRRKGIIFDEQKGQPSITLTVGQAVKFLQHQLQPKHWKSKSDPLRSALGQLVFEASHPPYDSSENYLRKYPFDSIKVADLRIMKPLSPGRSVAGLKDTTILVVVDTLHVAGSDYQRFPFTGYEYPYQGDSVRVAVASLLDYLEVRDSSMIKITGLGNKDTPVWLNSKSNRMQRYWLRNELNDSVTVWIGATSRNTLGLYLEQGVTFRRPVMQGKYSEARIEIQQVDRYKLLKAKKIVVKTVFWNYHSEANFALSQASLSNWVKGGESSIAFSMDITGFADYVNKDLKVTSNNFARLKYGLIGTREDGVRKNLDLLETNSKLNHKAFGKFDFSGILLFKTQLAKGYNYPNDSVPVSKFMNPAVLTVGLGLDYKPNKNTSINFSPFSYKGTFVTDTAKIDQTKYGIAHNRKSLNEPGASFMITSEYKPMKTVTITNRLQLFTNYIHNPQNVDIDWEMILTANVNWFTDVRFNTHLIFDDDTKTPDLDKERKPLFWPDGKPKRSAKIQFKELLGFSFVFRF